MTRAHLAAMCLSALGCASVPLAPRVTGDEAGLLAVAARSPKHVAIAGCAPASSAGSEPCVVATRRVKELLQDTGLFARVGVPAAEADVIVGIHPPPARDEDAPPTSPGYFALSAVVPLWWSETYGWHLAVRDRSGREIQVDTTREGIEVMWGLAALLNLSPDRGFMPDVEREAAQVGLQLLPLWRVTPAGEAAPPYAGGIE